MRTVGPRGSTVWRAGRLTLTVFLGGIAVLLVLVVAALGFVRWSWGARYLLQETVLPRVNAGIAGRLAATGFEWRGRTFALRGLTLHDPDGQLVASVAQLEARVDLGRLLRRAVVVESLRVERPWLGLRTAENGESNLGRALASKKPASPPQPAQDGRGESKPWAFELRQLRVVDGSVNVQEEGAESGGPARLRVAEIIITATASWNAPSPGQVALTVETKGRVEEPVAVAMQAQVRGAGSIERGAARLTGEARLASGQSTIALTYALGSPAGASRSGKVDADIEVTLTRLHLEPSLARALLPAWRLARPLSGTGGARWAGKEQTGQARLDLAAGATRIEATASVAGAAPASARVTVRGRALDLAGLDARLPPSRLAVEIGARAESPAPGKWRGSANAEIGPGLLHGRPVGPIRARATARDGDYRLDELRASLPGVTLTARGSLTAGRLGFRASLDLSDLGLTMASLVPEQAPDRGTASGRGHAEITVGGSLSAPALAVSGDFTGLRWATVEIPHAELVLAIPDLGRPLASRLDLRVPSARAGQRRVSGLSVRLRGDGGRFDTLLEVAAPGSLRLAAGGTWRQRGRVLILDRATLGLGEQSFHLTGPARFDLEPGRFRLAGVELSGPGGQSFRLAVASQGKRWDARVGATALDLGRLPDFVVPEPARMPGRLTADLRARGGFGGATVDGRIELASDLASASGRFALPLAWPPPPGARLDAELSLSGVDLARVVALTRPAAPGGKIALAGVAAAQLRLTGTARDPRVVLRADLRGLRIRGQAVGDVGLAARAEDRKTVHADLDFAPGGKDGPGLGRGSFALDAGIGIGALLEGGVPRDLSSVPVELRANLEQLPLAGLAAVAGLRRKLGGAVALSAVLTGTAAAPRGDVELRLAGFSAAGVPATDGELRVHFGRGAATADASLARRGATLLAATARIDGSPADWHSPARLGQRPVELRASFGPIEFQYDGSAAGGGQVAPRSLRGKAHGQVELTGTPRNPRLQVHAQVADLRLDGKAMGEGEVELGYAERELRASARLASANGGELRAQARLDAEVGYPDHLAFRELRRSPFSARVEATGLDLTVLSGATPGLRSVSGQLFAKLEVDGSLADPRPSGQLEWKDGGLTVTGMGEYKNVKLRVRGNRERLVLEELSAESGEGRARVTAEATRRSEGGYQVETRIGAERLPLYVEGQALAHLSLDASAKATVAGGRVRARSAISSARIALLDVERKHLRKLALPGDVVLVEGGQPLDEAEARKLAAIEASLRKAGEGEAQSGPRAPSAPPEVPDPTVVLSIDANNNLWVRGKDANLELGLEPGFRIEVAGPARVYGRVLIKRGRVDIAGKRFDLEEGSSLRFSGAPDRPELDVSARHHNENENITVVATVKGAPGHLQTSLTSPGRPDLAESQLYTLVVTGRLRLGGGSASSATPAEHAQSIVGGLLAGQLQKLVAKKLPFDVLSIEGGATAGSARLEAGKYVMPDLYVGYVGRLGADPLLLQNRNAVHLEYDLSARWSFQGEYGDVKTGSADLVWTKRY